MIPASMGRSEDTVSALDFMPSAFSIDRLKRHDGGGRPYWSCDIVFPEMTRRIHNRHGAWFVQDPNSDRLADPEFAFGGEAGRRVKFEVSLKVAPLERQIRDATGG
jgi:hypothetical protein